MDVTDWAIHFQTGGTSETDSEKTVQLFQPTNFTTTAAPTTIAISSFTRSTKMYDYEKRNYRCLLVKGRKLPRKDGLFFLVITNVTGTMKVLLLTLFQTSPDIYVSAVKYLEITATSNFSFSLLVFSTHL